MREAVEVGRAAVTRAPSFTQVWRQIAIAEDDFAQIAAPGAAGAAAAARAVTAWRDVVAHSVDDAPAVAALARAEARLATASCATP